MALVDEVPSSALAIYAHPDDADVSCGGTLALWVAAGAAVEVVIATTGDKGTADPTASQIELVSRRADEAQRALDRLGIADHHQLGIPDGEVVNDRETRARLVGLIRSFRPEVVVGPDPTATFFGSSYVNHRDHRELGWAVLDAVAPAAASPLYFAEQGPPHQIRQLWLSGTLEPDTHVDIGSVIDAKIDAITCHATQIGVPGEWLRNLVVDRAAQAGHAVGVSAAESFRRLVFG